MNWNIKFKRTVVRTIKEHQYEMINEDGDVVIGRVIDNEFENETQLRSDTLDPSEYIDDLHDLLNEEHNLKTLLENR